MGKRKMASGAAWRSLLCAALCLGLLVGTTFAWFSDRAATGKTTITAGNLDVALMVEDGDTFTEADGETQMFGEPTLWEPGAMSLSKAFYVRNNGNLALKYALATSVMNEVGTADGKSLSDVIRMKVTSKTDPALLTLQELGEAATYADRAAAWGAIQSRECALGEYLEEGVLLPEGYSGTVEGAIDYPAQSAEENQRVIVLFWEPDQSTAPDNNDNFYNGTGAEGQPLSATFTVDVRATQTPAESDSFGSGYDDGIHLFAVSNNEELEEALNEVAEGDKIELSSGTFTFPDVLPSISYELEGEGIGRTVIEVTPNPDDGDGQILSPATGETITLSDMTIKGKDFAAKQAVLDVKSNDGNIVLDSVEIIGGNTKKAHCGLAISSHVDDPAKWESAASVTVKNCKITGAGTGISCGWLADTKLNVEGSYIDALYPIAVSYPVYLNVSDSVLVGWRTYVGERWNEGYYVNLTNVTFRRKADSSTAELKYISAAANNLRVGPGSTVNCAGCVFEDGFWFTAEGDPATINFNGCVTGSNTRAPLNSENVLPFFGSPTQHTFSNGEVTDNDRVTVYIDGSLAVSPKAE